MNLYRSTSAIAARRQRGVRLLLAMACTPLVAAGCLDGRPLVAETGRVTPYPSPGPSGSPSPSPSPSPTPGSDAGIPPPDAADGDVPPGKDAAPLPSHKIFVWFADGGPIPKASGPDLFCAGKTPPEYSCTFGAVAECKADLLGRLAKIYADFDVQITDVQPTSGAYYTIVVSNGASWCGFPAGVGGLAPWICTGMKSGLAHAFACGSDARFCAQIMAQESGHLIGLQHTDSSMDVMKNASGCTACNQFEDKENNVVSPGSKCAATQNSYQLMKARLGARR